MQMVDQFWMQINNRTALLAEYRLGTIEYRQKTTL
jgi:hypothetical protein